MFVIANILGSTIQISTLPLPVLSTLQASGLVFNSICATLILGEPFTRWSMYGTCLVCTGAVLIAVFGAIPAPTHSLDELLALLGRRPFVIWMIMTAIMVTAGSVATELVNLMSGLSQDSRFRLIRGLAYGSISGILSAHSLLVAKSAVELIIKTIVDDNNEFTRWQSWALVVALVLLALSQLYYLHRGLKLVSTSVLYPLVFCVYNIIAILDGLVYFHQTHLIKTVQAGLIAVGTVILLSGVLALSWRLSDEQHPPAVSHGSLAPGLGLVEDTEGEEESVDIIDSDMFTSEGEGESQPLLLQPGYETFGPSANGTAAKPVTTSGSNKKRRKPKWAETTEIWGELLDRDEDGNISAAAAKAHARRRSLTLPILHGRSKSFLGESGGARSRHSIGLLISGAGNSQEAVYGMGSRTWLSRRPRRRRKSMGFPGFTARRITAGIISSGSSGGHAGDSGGRSIASPFRGAVNGILKLKFWRKRTEGQGQERGDPEAGCLGYDRPRENMVPCFPDTGEVVREGDGGDIDVQGKGDEEEDIPAGLHEQGFICNRTRSSSGRLLLRSRTSGVASGSGSGSSGKEGVSKATTTEREARGERGW